MSPPFGAPVDPTASANATELTARVRDFKRSTNDIAAAISSCSGAGASIEHGFKRRKQLFGCYLRQVCLPRLAFKLNSENKPCQYFKLCSIC